jgi:membrane-bound metal-dependent hydrolase YbcI (DUF457 family)
MPFTVSHVAAVVPAYRPLTRAHMFSAAVIGSMAPDFGALLPESLARWQTHSLPALFSFCLPMGLLAWWLTQRLIKAAVIEVLPDRAWARARSEHPPLALLSPRVWVAAAAGILLGALTHLILDAFTHEDPRIAGHTLRINIWLQYGSSVLGLAVLALALALWLHHAPAPGLPASRRLTRAERACWIGLYGLIPLLVVTWSFGRQLTSGHPPWLSATAIGRDATWLLRGGAASLMVVSSGLRLRLGFCKSKY